MRPLVTDNLSDLILGQLRGDDDGGLESCVVNVDEAILALSNPLDFQVPLEHHRVQNVKDAQALLSKVVDTGHLDHYQSQ